MTEGPLAALDAIEKATGEREVNIIGYCLGGTLTAATLAHMAAKGDDRVKSAALIATMTDFKDLGEFAAITNDKQLQTIESYTERRGYVQGTELAQLFSLVRANDLIWSSVISNYLLAEDAVPSDMLFWFADPVGHAWQDDPHICSEHRTEKRFEPSGRADAERHADRSRRGAGAGLHHFDEGRSYRGVGSDLCRDEAVRRPVRFILGGSGHNAGIINPPKANKHGYWTHEALPSAPEEWLAGAAHHEGSWWPDWVAWVRPFSGEEIPARPANNALEPAPGSYALARA